LDRKAVAAALASVILFTTLVLADSTIMVADDNYASAAQASHIGSREALLREYSAGSAAFQALAKVQEHLASTQADCAALPEYLGSISAVSSVSGQDAGISYSSGVSLTADPQPGGGPDNLTVVAPFAGYRAGFLALKTDVRTSERGGGGLVSLERHEVHVLNLPVSPGWASSLCGSALASLGSALSHASCNATLSGSAFGSAMPALVAQAAARGFSLTAGWQLGGGCVASYWITLVEDAVGVSGRFEWTVRGSGAA